MYLAGRTYVASYFAKLGMNNNSLDFPTLYYLALGFRPLLLCSLFLFIILFLAKDQPNSFIGSLRGNLLSFGIAIILIHQALDPRFTITYSSRFLSKVILVIGVILLILSVILTIRKKSFGLYVLKMSPLKRLIGLLMVLLFTTIIADYFGNLRAVNLINGKQKEVIGINFTLKKDSKAIPQIEKKDFILIIQRNGKYFVTPPTQQFITKPEIFVVSENEVAIVKLFHLNR